MRFLIFYCLTSLLFLYGSTTTNNIKKSQKALSSTKKEKTETNMRLDKIAKNIKKAEKDIDYLDVKIDKLGEEQSRTKDQYVLLKKELNKSNLDLDETNKKLEMKRQKFVSLLSEQFSIVYAIKHFQEPTRESIIMQEIYKTYEKQNSQTLSLIKSDIGTLKKRKKNKKYLRDKTLKKVNNIIKKQKEYKEKKLAKSKILKKLEVDEEKYNSKLEKIVDKQDSLRSTLADLNILHEKETLIAKEEAKKRKKAIRLEKERKIKLRKAKAAALASEKKAKKAVKKAKTKEAKDKAKIAVKKAKAEKKRVYTESRKVRNINSSYKKSKTYAYRGGKTISPIRGAKVIKKFGTYMDPIYKIKIFNESITLKAPSSGAKVQNVLNGKVVFAGKSSMLGKVVVVAHSGKMHTVYAGLSKIAPNIKTGRKIKKGYVIGKVNSKLMFQATKNSKHINPLKLISI